MDVTEIDARTGITIERAFTAEEKAQRKKDQDAAAVAVAQQQAKEQAKAVVQDSAIAKLAALGFTADEIVAVTPADVKTEQVSAVLAAEAAAVK